MIENFKLMARYNRWMNTRMYASCATLSDADLRLDRGAFFGSIFGTLDHLLFGDLAWMGRFTGARRDGLAIGKLIHDDIHPLLEDRQRTDAWIIEWADGLEESFVRADLRYESNAYQRTRVLPTWICIQHMFNHQTHHRGQLTTLMSQAGLDFGVTDLPWMERENYADVAQIIDAPDG